LGKILDAKRANFPSGFFCARKNKKHIVRINPPTPDISIKVPPKGSSADNKDGRDKSRNVVKTADFIVLYFDLF